MMERIVYSTRSISRFSHILYGKPAGHSTLPTVQPSKNLPLALTRLQCLAI